MMKIAIIGAGNMGGAIARGLSQGTIIKAHHIHIADPNEQNLTLCREFCPDIKTFCDNKSAVQESDMVIIAVKPWLVERVANEIVGLLDPQRQIVLSVAAGVELAQLQALFGDQQSLFRVIPNTAIDVCESVNTIAHLNATPAQISLVTSIFDELGKSYLVDEAQLNALMSLSSCGIAYAFRYIRAATEGGVEMGLYPTMAKQVVLQTLRGAVKLLEQSGSHPEIEIDKVTTPGGITIKGLNEMEAQGFTNAVIKGLKASHIK